MIGENRKVNEGLVHKDNVAFVDFRIVDKHIACQSINEADAMLCSNCNEKPMLARGLCAACYYRQRRSGSVERRNVQNAGKTCSAEGCDQPAHAKGFCLHHYMQADHPLKTTWKILRSRNLGDYPVAWDRFEAFLTDVGERPSSKHQLRRIDADRPWSINNARWLAPVGGRQSYTKEQQAAYGREWHLQRKFKITGEEYAALLTAQGGGCAICGEKETHRHKSGKLKDLSVDHDHKTSAVRGLLCVRCNRGVGFLNDSADLLRRAADYLDRHADPLRCDVVSIKGSAA